MGEVWRARHLVTNERVAVKVMLDDLAQEGALQKRFLREARAAAAVNHPNVVELREVQQTASGAPFLVMELLTGETLGRRLRRKALLSVAEVAAIFLPVFDAVEAAHAAGIVHRDLKPENIFLAHDGGAARVRVRVLDFGIAKRMEKLAAPSRASAATTAAPETTAAMLGTPYYMAPEQALGERDIDGRADIWSLGVVLYECLSGHRPTEAATLGAILKIIVTDGVRPIRSIIPDLDVSVADALAEMLRSSREARAPSLDRMRGCLAALRDSTYLLDTETDEGIPASVERPSTQPALVALATPERARSVPIRWLGAAALAAVGVAAVARSLGGPTVEHTTVSATPVVTARADAEAATPAMSAASAIASASARPILPGPAVISGTAGPVSAVARARGAPAPVAAPAASGTSDPSRGPSGLVTDNPFGGPPASSSSAPR